MQPSCSAAVTMFHAALRPDGFLVLVSRRAWARPPTSSSRRRRERCSQEVGDQGRGAPAACPRGARAAARAGGARLRAGGAHRTAGAGAIRAARILVTAQREVVHCRGRMGPFLAPASTPPTVDACASFARSCVRAGHRAVADAGAAPRRSRRPCTWPAPGRAVGGAGDHPISADDDGGRCALVLFREQSLVAGSRTRRARPLPRAGAGADAGCHPRLLAAQGAQADAAARCAARERGAAGGQRGAAEQQRGAGVVAGGAAEHNESWPPSTPSCRPA